MKPALLAAVAASLWLPAMTWAAETCPWMNAATAGGLLGGAAEPQYAHGANDASGKCEFTVRLGGEVRKLEIEVRAGQASHASILADPRLSGAGKRELRGVGNEAWAVRQSDGGELVIGRVRNTLFEVLATGKPPAADAARKAAELVAGALF